MLEGFHMMSLVEHTKIKYIHMKLLVKKKSVEEENVEEEVNNRPKNKESVCRWWREREDNSSSRAKERRENEQSKEKWKIYKKKYSRIVCGSSYSYIKTFYRPPRRPPPPCSWIRTTLNRHCSAWTALCWLTFFHFFLLIFIISLFLSVSFLIFAAVVVRWSSSSTYNM